MLQSYSWSAFFSLMGGLSFLWYASVALTAYRKECLSFFKLSRGKPSGNAEVKSAVQQGTESLGPQGNKPLSIMGRSREAQGLESSSLAQVSFANDNQDGVGMKSDIIAELTEIFTLLAENDGEKGDFLGLLEAMKLRYPPIGGHPARLHINNFIKAHAPFLLSMEELENLWD